MVLSEVHGAGKTSLRTDQRFDLISRKPHPEDPKTFLDVRFIEVKGRDLVSGIPKTVTVHSQEVRECIQEPIQAIVDAVRRALEITPPELSSDIVDKGIMMTGGGALIRGLDKLLNHETNLPIHVDEEPLTCVVRGAGRILDDMTKYRTVLVQ